MIRSPDPAEPVPREPGGEPIGPPDAPPPTPEMVYREYAPRIYHIARRLLGNDADAEDVTQDVLLQVVRKLHTFRGESALPTWLHRVTVNAALAHREKRANRAKHETTEGNEYALEAAAAEEPTNGVKLPRKAGDPSALALAAEQRRLIDRAIAKLAEPYRDVYVLADVEGLPNAEIGDALGLSVPAVKSRLHRARLQMRDALAPHFEEAKS
jgi:RNA polymerase sigma-70 factor, ECF subfamily